MATKELRVGPYRLVRRLGAGAFGEVYLAERDGRRFAVKLETRKRPVPQLPYEARVLRSVCYGLPGFPRVAWDGVAGAVRRDGARRHVAHSHTHSTTR